MISFSAVFDRNVFAVCSDFAYSESFFFPAVHGDELEETGSLIQSVVGSGFSGLKSWMGLLEQTANCVPSCSTACVFPPLFGLGSAIFYPTVDRISTVSKTVY